MSTNPSATAPTEDVCPIWLAAYPQLRRVKLAERLYRRHVPDSVTLCVLLWAIEGRHRELSRYEDEVLGLIAEHGGSVLNRLHNVSSDDGPTEIHVLEFPSEDALDRYINDGRRLALAADRDRSIARTEVIRVQPMNG